jgi:phosphohistidine phosphatase
MDLILWRHADAQDGVPDLDRELTAKGRTQAAAVGGWLDARLPKATRILVSPAARARQTAEALGRPFEIVEAIAPGADETEILGAIGWPDAAGTVLVIGHQPTLGQVAGRLMFGDPRDFTLKKGGLVWLTSRTRQGENQVVLKAAMTAELV